MADLRKWDIKKIQILRCLQGSGEFIIKVIKVDFQMQNSPNLPEFLVYNQAVLFSFFFPVNLFTLCKHTYARAHLHTHRETNSLTYPTTRTPPYTHISSLFFHALKHISSIHLNIHLHNLKRAMHCDKVTTRRHRQDMCPYNNTIPLYNNNMITWPPWHVSLILR